MHLALDQHCVATYTCRLGDDSLSFFSVHLSDDENSDIHVKFNEADAKQAYDDWVSSQPKATLKMIAIVLMDTFKTRFGLTNVVAATEAHIQKLQGCCMLVRLWQGSSKVVARM